MTRRAALLLLSLGVAACSGTIGLSGDGGVHDAAPPLGDAALADAALADAALTDAALTDAEAGDGEAGDSGTDGGLVIAPGPRSALFPVDWQPGFADAEGRFLQDYSYAGYRSRAAEPPTGDFAAVFPVTADTTGQTDAAPAIASAIAAAAAAGGGIVFLPAGLYRLNSRIEVTDSQIVLRGAGPDQTKLLFQDSATGDGLYGLHFRGADYTEGNEIALVAEGAALDTSVRLASTAGLSVGDDIVIGFKITDAFKVEHNAQSYWYHIATDTWRGFFRRTVTAIDGATGTVHFQVPLRYAVKLRDGASLKRVTGYLTECGLESLAVSNAIDFAAAWQSNQYSALGFTNAKDCWVREVASFESPLHGPYHLRSHGLTITRCVRITVMDTHLARPQNRGGAGNGYLFHLSRSNEVLVRDSTAREARHNFSINWDFGSSGNVFLRVLSTGGRGFDSLQNALDGVGWLGPSDFHHSLSIANLIDASVIDDAWQCENRRDTSTGAGPTGTWNVFWNNRTGGSGRLRSLQAGMGYVIGTQGLTVETALVGTGAEGTAPVDYTEYLDGPADLSPPSLYEEQLARRRSGG